MRKLLTLLVFCLLAVSLPAQELQIKSFTRSLTDIMTSREQKKDHNGGICALIKVQMLDQIDRVEGNVIATEEHGTEKHIYVTDGTKEIRIYAKSHLPLHVNCTQFGIERLESKAVYLLVLQSSGGKFSIKVTPPNAQIEINSRSYTPGSDGLLVISLPYQRYHYRVTANGYESAEGSVFVTDDIEQQNIVLKPLDIAEAQPEPKPEPVSKPDTPTEQQPEPPIEKLEASAKKPEASAESPRQTIVPKARKEPRQLFLPSGFYVQPTFQAGSLTGVGAAAGAYFNALNVEAAFLTGLSKSEEIYWNYTGNDDRRPVQCVYKPTVLSVRGGYGIVAGGQFRVTPQAGADLIQVSGDGSKCNVVAAVVDARIEWAPANHVGLFVTPQMGFALAKSNIYKQVEPLSSTIKGWGSGFNVRAGLTVFF